MTLTGINDMISENKDLKEKLNKLEQRSPHYGNERNRSKESYRHQQRESKQNSGVFQKPSTRHEERSMHNDMLPSISENYKERNIPRAWQKAGEGRPYPEHRMEPDYQG